MNGLLTKREVAELLKVSPRTVDNYIARGLPTVRLSPGTVRVRASDLERWVGEVAADAE